MSAADHLPLQPDPGVVGRILARHADFGIALLITALGLVLFTHTGLRSDGRAGFQFLRNIEQRSLDMRFWLCVVHVRAMSESSSWVSTKRPSSTLEHFLFRKFTMLLVETPDEQEVCQRRRAI